MKTRISPSLLALGATFALALTASSIQAQNATWTGGNSTSAPSWGAFNNWSTGAAPTFSNTTNLTFDTSAVPITGTFLGANRTVRSITFGADVDAAMGVNLQDFNFGAARTLTMDTDVVGGNATISVLSGSTGNVTFGNATSTGGTIGTIILADNLLVDHNGSGRLNFNRAITGAGFSVTKTGSGTMVFNSIGTSPNTFSGNMNINGGRLIANGFVVATDLNNAANINMGGGVLEVQNVGGANKDYNTVGFNVNSASTLAFGNQNNTSYTLTFSGASSFALGADLRVQNISVNQTLANTITISRSVTGAGAMIIDTYTPVSSGESNLNLGRALLSGNNTAWSGGLNIAAGSVTLAGNSTLGSGVEVNAGTGTITLGVTGNSTGVGLQLAAADSGIKTITNNITVASGGYRLIKLFSDNTYNLNGNINLQGDLNLHNAAFNTDKRLILNGNISGPGGLNITENLAAAKDFIRLTGNNTYSGATTIGTNATLNVLSASGNGIGDSSAVSFSGDNSALSLNGNNETIGSLASSFATASVVLGNGTLTTGGDNSSTSFDGSISGVGGGLSKVGSGSMTLNGTNSYTGTTTVSAGTLVLGSAATLSSVAVIVEAGATLNTSALSGGLAIASGRRIGGDGTVTGDLSLASGAQFVFTIGATLDVSGAVTLDNSFSVASLVTSTGDAIDWSTVANGTYTLINNGSDFGNIGNFGLANRADLGGGKEAYFQNGSLQLVVIPEPSTWALLAVGMTSVVLFRRRRRA